MKNILLFLGLLLLSLLAILSGCDQRVSNTDVSGYSINGSLIKNLDNDSIVVSAAFMKNDSALAGAIILLGTDTLKYNNTLFLKSYTKADTIAPGTHHLYLTDPNGLDDSISFAVPANFAISNIALPDNRVNPGGETVPIEWQASAGSNGYAFGVIKKDTAYKADGYSQFVATGATSANIPRDAYRLSGDLDTGWYYVYIYAYFGSPTVPRNLPAKFPSGRIANVTHLNLSGNWGAIIVSRRDSIHVQTQ
jgi:hypothetical protein